MELTRRSLFTLFAAAPAIAKMPELLAPEGNALERHPPKRGDVITVGTLGVITFGLGMLQPLKRGRSVCPEYISRDRVRINRIDWYIGEQPTGSPVRIVLNKWRRSQGISYKNIDVLLGQLFIDIQPVEKRGVSYGSVWNWDPPIGPAEVLSIDVTEIGSLRPGRVLTVFAYTEPA